MVSKKVLLVEEVLKRSPNSERKQLERMTIHSLNTLLSTLNGVVTDPIPQIDELKNEKLTRKVRSKKRKVDDNDADADADVKVVENEIIEDDDVAPNEYIIPPDDVIVPDDITQTKKPRRGRPAGSKTNKNKDIEIDISPEKKRKSTAMSSEKKEVKEILDDFKKEISKLIVQYKKIKNKEKHHRDKLIDIYNDLYDNTVDMIEKQIQTSYFPDESIYDYSEQNLNTQKLRIEKLLSLN